MKMNVIELFKIIHSYILWFLLFIISSVVFAIFINGYFDTPNFLFSLKDKILSNKKIISAIGGDRGTIMEFSKNDLLIGDSANFRVTIIGECDSAYVVMKGKYYKNIENYKYIIRDTIIVNKCR